jgi:D-alanyl-D-alanine carboxypeptidase (penicillin-binding protein 5/6)
MFQKYFVKSLVMLVCLFSLAFADEITTPSQPTTPITAAQPLVIPQRPNLVPSAPSLNVKAYVLMDGNNGKILAEQNMDNQLPPASLTKMMTLYLASRALASGQIHLEDMVTISKKAWQTGGSKMFIRVGSQVSVQDLLMGIIVASGNDACVAMSEFIAGDEDTFVQMMNEQAQALGMVNTHYVDCTGLQEPSHYSSAHDLAILGRHIINDFPQYYGFYKEKWFKYNNIRQPNRNRLLWRFAPYADGLKTGHTDAAGFCLVGSAVKDGMRLIAVVLGAPTDEARAQATQALLEYGYRFYESHLVFQANTALANPRVWLAHNKTVPAGVFEDFYVTVPKNQYSYVQAKIAINPDLRGPIQKGQSVGIITATLNNDIVSSSPLVALNDDPKGGIFRRSMDHIGHFFSGWFTPKAK